MTTHTTFMTLFDEQLGASDEVIKVTIDYGEDFDNDGLDDIRVTLGVEDGSNSTTEDMIGVAFDIQNNAVAGLDIEDIDISSSLDSSNTSTATPSYLIDADRVSNGTLGLNISGGGVDAPYDVAVKFNDGGSGDGIVQTGSFLITGTGDLDAESLLENTDWYIRLQSTDGGSESAKTAGFILDLPTPGGGGSSIDVEKEVSIDGVNWFDADTAAESITVPEGTNPQFRVTVVNDGSTDLTNVVVDDDRYDLNGSDPGTSVTIPTLAAGDSQQFIYTTTWEEGLQTNTASATSNEGPEDSDPANYTGEPDPVGPETPEIEIVKTTNGADGLEILAGSTVTWRYEVTTVGDQLPLTNVTVVDDIEGPIAFVSGDDGDGILEAGETWIYEETGIATVGNYDNTGTASGDYNGTPVEDTDPSSYFGADPSLVLDKAASFVPYDPDCGKANVGDVITYAFTVTNDGNIALNDVSIADSLISNGSLVVTSGVDADNDGDIDSLAVGETVTFTATYTVTDADAAATQVANTATATGGYVLNAGTSESTSGTVDFEDTETVEVNRAPDAIDNNYLILPKGTSVSGNVLTDNTGEGVDSDADGDTLTVFDYEAESAFGGTVSMNPDGSFTYTPADGFAGYDQFEYTIHDGCGGFDTATVFLEVQSQNQRSIEMDNLTAELDDLTGQPVADGNVVTGTFDIFNASDDPGLKVQIISVDVNFDEKSQPNGRGPWVDVDPSTHANEFWIDENANGILDGSETLLEDINTNVNRFQVRVIFEDDITIGYSSTFTNGEVPDPLRVNASAQIYGRDRVFGFTESFDF